MSRGGSGGNRATPGRQYVLEADGTLEDIGVSAFGKPGQGPLLWGANPHLDTTAKLPKGTVVLIPGEPAAVKLTGRGKYDLTCIVNGLEIPLAQAKVVRTMDTGADGWAGKFAWTPGADPDVDYATRPFGYTRSAIYIGNQLVIAGCLYDTEPEMTRGGMVKGLQGYSFTVDAVDSSVLPPYELNNVTLKELGERYANMIGVKVVFDPSVSDDAEFMAPFKIVAAQESERAFDHLAKLAAQRGGLLSCTPEGDMLFLRARDSGKTVGALKEGGPFVTGWKASYNGRKRWHSYTIITAGVKGRIKAPVHWEDIGKGVTGKHTLPSTVTEIDKDVPRTRFQTFRADDVTPGNIANAARWKRNKHFADALTIPFPVSDWYAPDGTLWDVNTLVSVTSPTLGVPSGYTFLIRSVEFDLDAHQRTATLHLIPPQAFSGREVGEIWK